MATPMPQRTHYLFVDGGYLDHVLEDMRAFYNDDPVDLDYEQLGASFSKVFYYHCPPPQGRDESPEAYELRLEPYLARMRGLGELRGWHVFHGITKRQPKRGNVQKEVDVQIAVDLLSHSFKRNMDEATLIAGDQDFRPVVEAVVREGMFLTLWSDPRSTSSALRSAADHRRAFDPWQVNALLTRNATKIDLPEQHNSASAAWPSPARAIERGESPLGHRYVLFEQPDRSAYQLVRQERVGAAFPMYQHKDSAFLKKCVERLHGGMIWTQVAE